MKRFTTGLLFGASASGIAYAADASPLWTWGIGLAVALVIWFAEKAVEVIEDVIDDLF